MTRVASVNSKPAARRKAAGHKKSSLLPSLAKPLPSKYVAACNAYARGVVDGSIPAGQWVRKAAKRHLDDLERWNLVPSYRYGIKADGSEDRNVRRGQVPKNPHRQPYIFDPEKAHRVCEFIELLPHTKGAWAQRHELIVLQPWQCFLVCVLFGWMRTSNYKRRFRAAYWEIPRKNGKSILAAAIGLYMFVADDEYGAEVYSGATSEKQAWEVFKPAKLMLEKTPELADELGAQVWAKVLVEPRTGSKFEPVIGNPGDGPSPSCAIVDEYHEHATPALHDSMETGMGAREQPLMLVITTAGTNIAGPCHEKHSDVRKVLDKVFVNEELFGCIFSSDEKDDWADPKTLRKANPNFNVSVDGEFLLSQQRQAIASAAQQSKFKTKHLNVWCSVLSGWMPMEQWNLAADKDIDEDELIASDAECFFSIDLASKSDLCTEQRLYKKFFPNQDKPHFYLFGRYWLPEAAIEEHGPNKMAYDKWVKKGLLTQTEGATVDFELIKDQVLEDAKRCNPKEVIYDPYNATPMAQKFVDENLETVEFTQTPQNFAVPMDEMVSAVKDGRFHHDGNEITTWCVSNVVARPARKGLYSPAKAKPEQKIDGAVASIMGVARATTKDDEPAFQMLTL